MTPSNEVPRSAASPGVAVVTGASRGLGAGIAKRFAARGISVGLCARQEPNPPDGAPSVCGAVDVRSADALDAFARRVTDELGPIELWVNNAGVLDPIGPLRAQSPDALRDHLDVNILGVVLGSRAFARIVHARDSGGTLVNISSGAGRTAYSGWGAYCAAKAAVDHLSRVLALEGREDELRVASLAPGVVDTDMQALIRATPVEAFPTVERFQDLKVEGAFNEPDWVADRVLELAGPPGAAGWVHDSVDPVVLRVPDQPRS